MNRIEFYTTPQVFSSMFKFSFSVYIFYKRVNTDFILNFDQQKLNTFLLLLINGITETYRVLNIQICINLNEAAYPMTQIK